MIKYLAHILLFVLPFHAFLSNYFRFGLDIENFWLWKELFLAVILVLNFGYQKISHLKQAYFNWTTLLVVLYGILIAVSALWAPGSGLGRIFVGIKFDYLIFIALIAGLSFGSLKKEEFVGLLRPTFIGGSLAIIAGLGLHFLLGPENFTMFGYRDDWSTYVANKGLAFCQKIEGQNICRFQGTFSGPNQAGFYLIMYLPIAYYFLKEYWSNMHKRIGVLACMLAGFGALVLTFSRSAWLGTAFAFVLMSVFMFRKMIDFHTAVRVGVIGGFTVVMGLVALILIEPDFVIRPLSSMEHLTKWMEGIYAFIGSPLIGQGVGTAGPASRILSGFPLIPENWFLQVAVQYGLLGLGLFASIYAMILRKLFKKGDIGKILFVILASMLVPAMFLHVFEDSVMSYTLMLLVGAWLVTD